MGCVSLNEELLFRGYILQNFITGFWWLNRLVAVLIGLLGTGFLFVLFHANPLGDWSVTLDFLLTSVLLSLPISPAPCQMAK